MFDVKVNMSRMPLSTTQSKKERELPSPEFLLDTKKNHISASVFEAASESEESENMSLPTVHDAASGSYTNITLQESGLQKWQSSYKVSKVAKIRIRYNQVPHLIQDTNGKVTNSQLDTTNESQEVSPFPTGDHKTRINRRTTFQPRLAQQIQESFKFQVSDLVKSIVEVVLEGLQTLKSGNAEFRLKIQRLKATTELTEQYSRLNCPRISGVPNIADENTDDYIMRLCPCSRR